MLWEVVYNFFIHYIFGGRDSNGQIFYSSLGFNYNEAANDFTSTYTQNIGRFAIFTTQTGTNIYMSLGNYLSLIATIISMVVILVICCALIKKIYNMCAHIIG